MSEVERGESMDTFRYFVYEVQKDGTEKLIGIFNDEEYANDLAEYEETFLKAHYVVREGEYKNERI